LFGGAFNPNAVTVREVGTATFTGIAINSATLSYSVDGVGVTKSLTRQTWRADDLTGQYIGAVVGTYSGCATGNGYREEPAFVDITHSGSNIVFTAQFSGQTCTYTGGYAQAGRMAASAGSVSCQPGGSGTYTVIELQANITAFSGRATANFGGTCQWSGRIGGLYRGA
jgi:hypothetical protein